MSLILNIIKLKYPKLEQRESTGKRLGERQKKNNEKNINL